MTDINKLPRQTMWLVSAGRMGDGMTDYTILGYEFENIQEWARDHGVTVEVTFGQGIRAHCGAVERRYDTAGTPINIPTLRRVYDGLVRKFE